MSAYGWIELIAYTVVLILVTKPVGLYLKAVLEYDGKTWIDPIVKPFEKLTYKVLGIDPKKEQNWFQFTVSLLVFSLITLLFTYFILRFQDKLPGQARLNPQGLAGLTPDLSFNTAASFATNTNWQSYAGESTMSYFSQMVALVIHNFFSPAVGLAVAAAFVRGIARRETEYLGNFWVDMVRVTYYMTLPICLIGAIIFLWSGSPQNFKPYDQVKFLDPFTTQVAKTDAKGNPVYDSKGNAVMVTGTIDTQTIVEGPIASQLAIKMLGTNGGGYVNANSAHPFENSCPLMNFFQMIWFIAISVGLTYYLGASVGNIKHGWAVWIAMYIMLLPGVLVVWHYEAAGNPIHIAAGVDPADGNMEGKEVRFGLFESSLFAASTTATGCGAVNCMHDSLTPMAGFIPIFNIQLGEVVFGGVGSGMYGILVYIAVTVFIAGLMIGRTPEYLGKKVQSKEVKLASFYLLIFAAIILMFSAGAVLNNWGPATTNPVTNVVTPSNGTNNNGPHGFTEILYAFSEAAGNNGSAFAGLSANAPGYNTALGIAILLGRYAMLIPALAIAGSLAKKKISPPGPGSFPVHTPTFVFALVGVVVLVGALNFLPALALGPIVEHFLMHAGQVF
jgi:K+-transporting ATPase ATPase A chain